MTLTAGSTLQNGKYVIQSTLHQSDFGVTYQAIHKYLQQSVVLQTFNECLKDHSNFSQLRQLFLDEVRQRSSINDTQAIQVLDGFEEEGMPYVVLQPNPEHPHPKLRDWLPLTRLIVQKTADTEAIAPPPVAISPPTKLFSQPSVGVGFPAVDPNYPDFNLGASPNRSLPAVAPASVPTPPVMTTLLTPPSAPTLPVAHPRSRPWLPVALMATAILAGVTGAGLGWVVRFENLGQPDGDSFSFGKDQNFPPSEDWPITGASELEVDTLRSVPASRPRRDRDPIEARPRRQQTTEWAPDYAVEEPVIDPVESFPAPPTKVEPDATDAPVPQKEPPVIAPPPIADPAPTPIYSSAPPPLDPVFEAPAPANLDESAIPQ